MKAVAALALTIAVLATVSPAGAQTRTPAPPPAPFRVRINASTLAGLPHRTVTATDEGGHTNSYGGVSLHDLLVRAGTPTGQPVRGKAMLSYVVIGAADGYHVLFSLPELDPSFTDHVVLIADSRDGKPLSAQEGPYRLIVPFDKRDARWVREVTEVDLENASLP